MRWSSSATQVLVAVAGLLTPVDAQAYFGDLAAELSACGSDDFASLGCFGNFLDDGGSTWFQFSPRAYSPTDPSSSWPGWDPGSNYDDTVTPLDCARVCRGFGYKYAAVRDTDCNCGMEIPAAVFSTPGVCDTQCGGDGSQTCGGGDAAQIYADPSFADPNQLDLLTDAQVASYYQYIGCYSIPSGLPTQDPRARPLVDTIDDCFQACASLRLPLVFGAQE